MGVVYVIYAFISSETPSRFVQLAIALQLKRRYYSVPFSVICSNHFWRRWKNFV